MVHSFLRPNNPLYNNHILRPSILFIGANSGILLGTINWSLGQYIPDSLDQASKDSINEHSRFLLFLSSLSYAFSLGFSKLAILSLYWRIFQLSVIRIPIQITYGITIIWLIVRLFMLLFRCSPVRAYWDKEIPGEICPINEVTFYFATIFTHMILDIIILVLPIIEVFKLRLRLGQKIGVAALFLIGIV